MDGQTLVATDWFIKLNKAIENTIREFANYSTLTAMAARWFEGKEYQRTLIEAKALEQSRAELTKSWSDLKDATLPLIIAFKELVNATLTAANKILGGVIGNLMGESQDNIKQGVSDYYEGYKKYASNSFMRQLQAIGATPEELYMYHGGFQEWAYGLKTQKEYVDEAEQDPEFFNKFLKMRAEGKLTSNIDEKDRGSLPDFSDVKRHWNWILKSNNLDRYNESQLRNAFADSAGYQSDMTKARLFVHVNPERAGQLDIGDVNDRVLGYAYRDYKDFDPNSVFTNKEVLERTLKLTQARGEAILDLDINNRSLAPDSVKRVLKDKAKEVGLDLTNTELTEFAKDVDLARGKKANSTKGKFAQQELLDEAALTKMLKGEEYSVVNGEGKKVTSEEILRSVDSERAAIVYLGALLGKLDGKIAEIVKSSAETAKNTEKGSDNEGSNLIWDYLEGGARVIEGAGRGSKPEYKGDYAGMWGQDPDKNPSYGRMARKPQVEHKGVK